MKKMDRKLTARQQRYEVEYVAKKFKISVKKVRDAIKKVGSSRRKLYAYLRAEG